MLKLNYPPQKIEITYISPTWTMPVYMLLFTCWSASFHAFTPEICGFGTSRCGPSKQNRFPSLAVEYKTKALIGEGIT